MSHRSCRNTAWIGWQNADARVLLTCATALLEYELDDRELMLRALALHRGTRARGYLLELVACAEPAEARAAIKALAEHRYDAQLCERVHAAASNNPDPSVVVLARQICCAR